MIKDIGGKVKSERTTVEVVELLKREIATLSKDEQEVLLISLRELDDPAFKSLAEQAISGGPPRIMDVISAAEYIRPVVDITTFVKDPYYLGNTCANLYPKLLDALVEIFDGGYKEVIVTGAIGAGKTFMASIIVCRCLYEISCLKDPHKTFGLSADTNISYVGLSVNESLAQKVVFENIATKLKSSPYFQNNFPFEETKKEMRFPHSIWVAARSSSDTSALGLNVIGFIMDEGNFLRTSVRGQAGADARWGTVDQAQNLYDMLKRRIKSRFQMRGKLPGMMLLVSSKRTKDDFTARRIREAKDDPDVYVSDFSLWDVRPEDYYSSKKFHVLVGNETSPSKVLLPEEVDIYKEKIKDGQLIIEVPEDFKSDFLADLEGSIRDIAGIETVSISPYLQQRDKIISCVDKGRQHPFDVVEWDQSKPGGFIWSRLAKKQQIRDGAEVFDGWQPVFYPGLSRHIHIDPSLNSDATGIAMGCVIGQKNVERRDRDTNELVTEQAPVIWIDFILRIVPPTGGEIDHGKIRQLVYQLQSHGFMIGLITMDQYNSASSLQKFMVKGITAERLSVDKPLDAYDTLKSAIYEERVMYYEYEPLLEELRNIQHDRAKNKVDHPKYASNGKKGAKDCADATTGVVYSLTTRYRGVPMPMVKGISEYPDPIMEEQRKATDETEFIFPFLRG